MRFCRPLAASLFFKKKKKENNVGGKKGITTLGSKATQKQAKASLGLQAMVSQFLLKVLDHPVSTLLAASGEF